MDQYLEEQLKNLIQFNNGGVVVANYPEIKNVLVNVFKNIYGTDIDISDASADGQYVHSIALLINNILQLVNTSYLQLNPASATGHYLDILCSFSNVFRKNESYSVAQLVVKYIGNSTSVVTPTALIFRDRAGIYWQWNNPVDINGNPTISWTKNGDVNILENVVCQNLGNITALGTNKDIDWNATDNGWINQSIEIGQWQVYQQKDAIVGNLEETDESLRSRRIQALGNQSVSVLTGLQGVLFNTTGIKDCWIYSNGTTKAQPMDDLTSVAVHDVYITLRYDKNVDKNDLRNIIGNLIYNKMTPGILTSEFNSTGTYGATGETETFEVKKTTKLSYDIRWKICKPETPTLTIKFNYFDGYAKGTKENRSDIEKSIIEKILNYTNNITLANNTITTYQLITAINQANIIVNNTLVFIPILATINEALEAQTTLPNSYQAHNTYFEYDESMFDFTYDDSTKVGTLTIKKS